MAISERDYSIIEKMYQYCIEIEEAHTSFNYSFEKFSNSSLYRNAVSFMCHADRRTFESFFY